MPNQRAIRKVLSKLSVNGSTLKTRMTPEFLQLIADYDKYEELVVDLVDKLESLMQPDSSIIEKDIEYPPGEHPLENLTMSLGIFQTYLFHDCALQVSQAIQDLQRVAGIHRDAQTHARNSIERIWHFNNVEYYELLEERSKLNKATEYLDQMKMAVKQAKTTEQVEKRALIYEQAVRDFDAQTVKVVNLLEQLPTIQQSHQKGLVDYFNVLCTYNEEVTKLLKQY